LAAMQHFGVATRLLDWTTQLEVALYFAIANLRKLDMLTPDDWPCIWVLNPYRLNRCLVGDDVIFDRADPVPYDYYTQTVACIKQGVQWPHESPIAINPGFTNRRIEAQHGRFTVHGSLLQPLGTPTNPPEEFWGVRRVVIDPNDWGELRTNAVRDATYHLRMFPDIEGFARFLNQRAKA
jgi:hypothetical protein